MGSIQLLLSTTKPVTTSRMLHKVLTVAYSHPRGDRKKATTPRVKKYNLMRPHAQLKRKPSMLGFS